MTHQLGEKSLDVLRYLSLPHVSRARHAYYVRLCELYSAKAVERKCEHLADKGLAEYGTTATGGWLTAKGKRVLWEADGFGTPDPEQSASGAPARATASASHGTRFNGLGQTLWVGHWRRTWRVTTTGAGRVTVHYTPFGSCRYIRVPLWLARRVGCPIDTRPKMETP